MAGRPTLQFVGVRKLDAKLNRIAKKDARRIGTKAGRRAIAVYRKNIKAETPVGKTKRLRKAIGGRFRKDRDTNQITGKAGPNTAKKKDKQAGYGHIVAMDQGFVDRASAKSEQEAFATMKRTVAEEIKALK